MDLGSLGGGLPLSLTTPAGVSLGRKDYADVHVSAPAHAIRNARIVTVSGATLDRGTIVLERGLITAIGRDARVPAGAWVIDGNGLTVYPGLVDAMSTLGLPASLRWSAEPRFIR